MSPFVRKDFARVTLKFGFSQYLLTSLFLFYLAVAHLLIPCCHSAETKPLSLSQVEDAVLSHFPPLLIARIERDVASGRLLSTWGAFDPQLSAFADFGMAGFYDGNLYGTQLEYRDPNGRTRVYGGYRYSEGSFPDYEKGRTSAGGQFVLGVRVPLLRDGSIDAERLQRDIAGLDLQGVEPLITFQRIELVARARRAYLNWLSAGLEEKFTRELLELATDREQFLQRLVEEGEAAAVTQLDNQRLVAARQLSLSQAKEKTRANAIELSLFFRDSFGKTIEPENSQLPSNFPTVELFLSPDTSERQLINLALTARPELKTNSIEIRKNELAITGAENLYKPRLDLTAEALTQAGAPRTFDRADDEVRAGLQFSIPLGRREARGQIKAFEARGEQLRAERNFIIEQLSTAVQTALNNHQRAAEQLEFAKTNLTLAQRILDIENISFLNGQSNLLELQIREEQFFNAELDLIRAQSALIRSWIDLEAAIGRPNSRPIIVR